MINEPGDPMHPHLVSADQPLGLAFELADLLLASAVAEARALRMVVELDHHVDRDEMEEVVALYHGAGDACRCLIWRSADSVVVQPMPGRPRYFASMNDALAWLEPDRAEPLSDLVFSSNRAVPQASRAMPRERSSAGLGEIAGGGSQLRPFAG